MTSLNSIQNTLAAPEVLTRPSPASKLPVETPDLDGQILERLRTNDPAFDRMLSRIRQIAIRQRPLSHHLAHPRPRPILRVRAQKQGGSTSENQRNYLTLGELREYKQTDPALFALTKKALTDNIVRIIYDTAAAYQGEHKVDFDHIYAAAHQVFDRLLGHQRGFGGINVFTHLLHCTHQVVFGKAKPHTHQ
jgi:hypothetical protein